MFLAGEIRKRVMGESTRGMPAGEASSDGAAPRKTVKLRDAFFNQQKDGEVKESNSSFFGASPSEEGAARFSPLPPITVGPQLEEYDKLALILHASLERRKNRRRLHEYTDTFYGKHAVDWLVGTQTFPDASDARNAMRHLMNRRLVIRADHTKPFFNGALERVAPKMAQSRRADLINRYASPARGFHDEHLYRFPPEAFSKIQLNVRIVRARNLRFKSRPHLGTFVISSKFREQRIDPYCLLEFGPLSAKTDTWSDGGNTPVWESEFSFPVESNSHASELSMKDLWVRVLDFHEVLDDLELGFCLVPREEIMKNCAAGRVWTAWHVLKAASELSTNERATGEVELAMSLSPFIANNPLWTVHKEARAREPQGADMDVELDDSADILAATFERVGDVVNQLGGQMNKIVDPSGVREPNSGRSGEGGTKGETDDDGRENRGPRFKLQVYRFQLAPNITDIRPQSLIWVEYTIMNPSLNGHSYRGRSEIMTWPVKDFGLTSIRGLTQDDIQNSAQRQVLMKVYAKVTGITLKIGETSVPLKLFMPDLDAESPTSNLDEIDWKSLVKQEKVILRRTAAFRRNRKRIVGEVGIKAIIEPDNSSDADDDGSIFGDDAADETQANMMLEDDLSNVGSMLSENGFSMPEPLQHMVLKETFKDCPFGALFWYVLSRNSPLLPAFSAKKNFTNLNQGDWRWGGRDRRGGSYVEDPPAEDPILALADATKGGVLINRSSASEPPPPVRKESDTTPQAKGEGTGSAPATPTKSSSPIVGRPRSESNGAASSRRSVAPPLVKQESLSRLNDLQEEKRLPIIPSPNEDDDRGASEEGGDTLASLRAAPASEMPQKSLGKLEDSLSSQSGDESPSRLVTYTRPPEMAVGELQVKETWRLKAFAPEKGFWLEIEGTTNEPMYGKQMAVIVQLVGVLETETSCSLTISCSIKWSPRPMTAGIVERTAFPGTTKGYQLYVSVLKSIMKKKSKGKGGEKEGEEEEEEAATDKAKMTNRQKYMLVCLILLRIVALLFVIALILALVYYIFVTRREHEDIAWVSALLDKVKEKTDL